MDVLQGGRQGEGGCGGAGKAENRNEDMPT